MPSVSIDAVQKDWHVLDDPDIDLPDGVRLISHEHFHCSPPNDVEYIAPGICARAGRFWTPLYCLFYGIQLLRQCSRNTVLILNGGGSLWIAVGLMNRLPFIGGRRILCWDIFVEVSQAWKRKLLGAAMRGFRLSLVWSKAQVATHAMFLGMPEERFVYLPFKANHSRSPHYDLPVGHFVFSGGNGKRDYRCLIDAVRGTNIPVIISATAPQVRKQIEPLPNVIVLGAPEPGFAQLQAASQFIVIPMTYTGLKGGGEANFCNGMWHGKPVIAADSIAASDYIVNGKTGYVVPSGDSAALRARIVELWSAPDKVSQMGQAARTYVERNFTHVKFISRLLKLALILGKHNQQRHQ